MSKTADEVSEVVEALRTHGSDDCDEAADLLEAIQKENESLKKELALQKLNDPEERVK